MGLLSCGNMIPRALLGGSISLPYLQVGCLQKWVDNISASPLYMIFVGWHDSPGYNSSLLFLYCYVMRSFQSFWRWAVKCWSILHVVLPLHHYISKILIRTIYSLVGWIQNIRHLVKKKDASQELGKIICSWDCVHVIVIIVKLVITVVIT